MLNITVSGSSLAASSWLRCTLSAVERNPRRRNILEEQLPSLTEFIPSIDYSTVLDSALSFSRQLCDLSASSNVLYRSFTPVLESGLDLERLDLAEECSRSARGEECKVGATVCMGLERVAKDPGMPEDAVIVKKARVICDCTLRHQVTSLSVEELEVEDEHIQLPAYDSVISTLSPQTISPAAQRSHSQASRWRSLDEGPSQPPRYDFKVSPPWLRTPSPDPQTLLSPSQPDLISSSPLSGMAILPYPISPYTADPMRSLLAEPAYPLLAGSSRELLTPAAQLASPILSTSLISSPAMSAILRQDNPPRIRPSPIQESPLHSDGHPSCTPLNNRPDNHTNELAAAMEEMNSRVTRIMAEVSALQAQMQALQLSRSFSYAGASSHLGLGAAVDALPPYLQ